MKKFYSFSRSFSAFAILGLAVANAQLVVAPPARSTAVRPAAPNSDPTPAPPASNIASALSSRAPLIQRGPVGIRPHLEYRLIYADGVQATPGDIRETYIQTLSPGLLIDFGKYTRLDYTPTWTFYSVEAFQDSIDHRGDLNVGIPVRRGSLGLVQKYESTHGTLVETGRQIYQENYSTTIQGAYNLGQRTKLESSLGRSVRHANALTAVPAWTAVDWVQWSSTNWVGYALSKRVQVGLGATLGYAEVDAGVNMRSITPQARLSWIPADKITLSVEAGEEDRRFEAGARPHLRSPVYTASAAYQILPTTHISGGANRSISASYFANEVTKNKGWNVGAQQRLLKKFYLTADLAHTTTTYVAPHITSLVLRDDRHRILNVRLTGLALQRIAVALLFESARNASSDSQFTFHTNQYGVELGLRW